MSEAPSPAERGHQSANGSFIAQAREGSTAIVAVFQAAPPRAVEPAEAAAAEAHLAALPLDPLPQRSGLPSPYVMPWPPNRTFVGREGDLLALARRLRDGGVAAVGQSPAVTGMGGQGKTQLAVEFAYRYGRWFRGGVFWVRCDDPATMAEAVAACGPALHPGDAGFSARPLPERVALVASAWASELPRLLIFDNCEDEAILDDWAPKGGGCRLLLTARRLSWSAACGIAAVPLGPLSRPDSVALLHRHRPDLTPDDPGLGEVAAELGDLPLALELAGSYLARYRDELSGAPASYVAELRAMGALTHASLRVEDPEAPGGARSPTGHERDVARTFEVSLRRLQPGEPVDALARELFARAAWLAPGVPIPRWLLKLCIGAAADDADASRRFADALGRLLDLALLERAGEGGAVMLHRLLAAFARSRMEDAEVARHAVEEVIAGEAGRLLSHNDPTPLRDWASHLVAVALAAGRDGTEAAINLLNAAGYYSKVVADFDASNAMLEMAAEYAEVLYGPDHPEVASTLGNLGTLQHERGRLAVAEASLTRALAIEEKAHGPDHPEVACTLGNLGNVQRERGQLAAAEASQTRALAIEEKAYGSGHPQVARTLGNLGNVQYQRGQLAAAQASQARALAIAEKAYGPDHSEVARTLGNLGNVQYQRGQLAAAEASQARALAIKEKAHGPDHPEVARTLGNLGNVQHERGQLAAAEASQTRALAIMEKAYGPDHSEVARTLSNLGNVQRNLGRISETRESYARAVTIFAAMLGEQHPHTAKARQLLSELGEKVHTSREKRGWLTRLWRR